METKVKNFLSELQSIKISMIPMKRIDDPEKKSSLRWNQDTPKPDFGGVYAFWWKGTYQSFAETTKEKKLRFKGPVKNGKPSELEMDLNSGFFGTADNGLTCLYVGKTHSSIAKRIGLHLRLGVSRTLSQLEVEALAPRSTTSCQIRDRLDRLFPSMGDTRILISKLAVSYVKLDGEEHFVERFFLEDLAIGHLRPVFNVDSER